MIGSIVFATEQGLGYLAKSFYDNGIIDLVSIQKHSSRTNHLEWYPDHVSHETLLEKCDTLIFFETPHDWKIIVKAREKGIRTILIPMYECTRNPFPYEPDEVWSPSALDHKFYGEKSTRQITIPVNIPWKLRTKAKVFVHNAGNGGLGGRNSTRELIKAMEYVKSPLKLIIRLQEGDIKTNDPRIEIRKGTFDDIWSEGDVFVFPEKFNGLSLPLQEAYASGMLVMCGSRFPMTEWLPKEPMISVESYKKEFISVHFESAQYSPQTIAKYLDEWYNKDISEFSLMGKTWAEQNSWPIWKEKYKEYLSQ